CCATAASGQTTAPTKATNSPMNSRRLIWPPLSSGDDAILPVRRAHWMEHHEHMLRRDSPGQLRVKDGPNRERAAPRPTTASLRLQTKKLTRSTRWLSANC